MSQESGVRSQESGVRSQESGVRKERDSSLELLRIVAMLMIVTSHFAAHSGFNFPTNTININRLWQQFLSMGGNLGNNLFVLISGYFLIKSSGVRARRLFEMWVKMFFYSVVILAVLIFLGLHKFSLTDLIYFIPVIGVRWWFASTYFVLYLIHPYLNIFLHSLSRKDYKKFLILILIMPTLLNSVFCSGVMNFICLYSLAGYFRLWAKDFGNEKFILYGICFIFMNFLTAICIDFIGFKVPNIVDRAGYFFGMMKPFTILATLCLLLGFRRLNIRNSKFINIIASATFGVYLIHEHNYIRAFMWPSLSEIFSFQNSPYLIPYSICVVLLVFTVCTLIEILRSKIFRLISRGKLS